MANTRSEARQAIRSQYLFVANDDEAFSVFGRSEVQDINRIRACTDVGCLVMFTIMLVVMLILDADARLFGNTMRLFEPIDFKGRLCGMDPGVDDKPLGYRPNPYNDMIICVSACPKTAADGNFTLPDGPMGKFHTRHAYPTAKVIGQHCLPLDLHMAKHIITVKDVQTEVYKALGTAFTAIDVIGAILQVPFITSLIYLIMLFYVPNAATTMSFTLTAITFGLTGLIMDLDIEVLVQKPLYRETHPLMCAAHPYIRDSFYFIGLCYAFIFIASLTVMQRAQYCFQECMASILNQKCIIVLFTTIGFTILRIMFILHSCKHMCLLMSILNPVAVNVQILGEWQNVERSAWSPYYLKGLFIYVFGTYWVLEFLKFGNKYVTSQIMAHNYFTLPSAGGVAAVMREKAKSPLAYALWSLVRYHLGSVAYAALLATPTRITRFIIHIFVPDRPNLQNSIHRLDRIAYYLFWPLIQFDLHFLRFFQDTVWVILPLKGYCYMDAARRSEGLINRARGKIPNLTKFTRTLDSFMNLSVGLNTMVWAYMFYRQPFHGHYHQVEHLHTSEALGGLFVTPAHSPLLVLPMIFTFGLWVGGGMLHLIGMASDTLTVCYCIDVEMAGGTETDALYVPKGLAHIYKDLGGGESERELAEMIAQGMQGGGS